MSLPLISHRLLAAAIAKEGSVPAPPARNEPRPKVMPNQPNVIPLELLDAAQPRTVAGLRQLRASPSGGGT
jgi:hypothetical protein